MRAFNFNYLFDMLEHGKDEQDGHEDHMFSCSRVLLNNFTSPWLVYFYNSFILACSDSYKISRHLGNIWEPLLTPL